MTRRATEGEARRFLEHAPRPKLRKAPAQTAGRKAPPAVMLHLVEDTDRGRVLVRGRGVRRVLEDAGAYERAAWSVSARGWVIDSADVADVAAAAEWMNALYTFRAFGGESDGTAAH